MMFPMLRERVHTVFSNHDSSNVCTTAGSLYRLHNGQETALSVPGCLDPGFSLPYSPSFGFPQISPHTDAAPPPTFTQVIYDCSNLHCGEQGSQLTQQSSSGGVHTNKFSLSHHQSAQHTAQLNRLGDGTRPVSRASSAASSLSSSNSNFSGGMRIPAVDGQMDCPLNAHFMAMAAKLIYEAPEIVADCLEHRCCAQSLFRDVTAAFCKLCVSLQPAACRFPVATLTAIRGLLCVCVCVCVWL